MANIYNTRETRSIASRRQIQPNHAAGPSRNGLAVAPDGTIYLFIDLSISDAAFNRYRGAVWIKPTGSQGTVRNLSVNGRYHDPIWDATRQKITVLEDTINARGAVVSTREIAVSSDGSFEAVVTPNRDNMRPIWDGGQFVRVTQSGSALSLETAPAATGPWARVGSFSQTTQGGESVWWDAPRNRLLVSYWVVPSYIIYNVPFTVPAPEVRSLVAHGLGNVIPQLIATVANPAADGSTDLYTRIRPAAQPNAWTNFDKIDVPADGSTFTYNLRRETFPAGAYVAQSSLASDYSSPVERSFTIGPLPPQITGWEAVRLNAETPQLVATVSNIATDGTTLYGRIRSTSTEDWTNLDDLVAMPSPGGVRNTVAWGLDRATYPSGMYVAQVSLNADRTQHVEITFTILDVPVMPDPEPPDPPIRPLSVIEFGVRGLDERLPELFWHIDPAGRTVEEARNAFDIRFREEPDGPWRVNFPNKPLGNDFRGSIGLIRYLNPPGQYRAQISTDNFESFVDEEVFTVLISAEEGWYIYINGRDYTSEAMEWRGRVSRIEGALYSRAAAAQAQIILRGQHRFPQDVEIHMDYLHEGVLYPIVHTFLESGEPSLDFKTKRPITIINGLGLLSLLGHAPSELSVFVTETIRTGELIRAVLGQLGRDASHVDTGQVRIHPAHYQNILSLRQVGAALPIIQGAELAEVGFVHEGPGDELHFEDRFHRELDNRLSAYSFGTVASDGVLRVIDNITPKNRFENVRNVVRVGAERATVLAEGTLWELPAPTQLLPDRGYIYDLTKLSRNSGLRSDAVKAFISLSPLRAADYTATNGATITLEEVMESGATSRTKFRIRTDIACELSAFTLRGVGLGVYGSLTIPERTYRDATGIDSPYRRRVLDLPVTFIGDGLNNEGAADDDNVIIEGQNYADLLLIKGGVPRATFPLPTNPKENRQAMVDLTTSDPVLILQDLADIADIPSGGYWVEGYDIQRTQQDIETMTYNVTERGRRDFRSRQDNLNVAGGRNWVGVGNPVAIPDGEICVVGAMLSSSGGASDPVARLTVNGEQRKAWNDEDLSATPEWKAGVVRGPANVAIQIRGGQISATALRIVCILG